MPRTQQPAKPRSRVLVLGAGPVGQTTALLLARQGLEPIVADGAPRRDPAGSKAIVQQRDVLDVWEGLGAGAVAEEGLTWSTARTFYRGRELFAVGAPDGGASPLPPFVNISQARTEEILDARLADEGIGIRWNHHITGVEQDRDGVTAVCATPGGAVRLRGDYAVVCLGAKGTAVRRSLGVDLTGTSYDDRFLICDIRADLPEWERERRFHFDPEWNPGRQVLIHPCPGSVFRIDWQVPPDFDLEREEAGGGLDRRIRLIIGDRPYTVVWRSVYRFHTRVADRMRVGRVLLAGDCAHLVAPFGARGLNSGVQDAENAAWKIGYSAAGWGAEEALLESYHLERHAAALENADVTSATMRFLVPTGPEEAAHRSAVLDRALTDPAAHPRVDSGRLAEPFWYTESPLTTPHPARVLPGRPERGRAPAPCPGTLVPDAPLRVEGRTGTLRLRTLAREGLTVLVTTPEEVAAVRAAAASATGAPLTVLAIAGADTTGALARALEPAAGDAWLLRPDAHIAAVADARAASAVAAAVRTALGVAAGVPAQTASAPPARTEEETDGVLPTAG